MPMQATHRDRTRALLAGALLLGATPALGQTASPTPPPPAAIVPPGQGMMDAPCPVLRIVLPGARTEPGKPAASGHDAINSYVANQTYTAKYDWAWLCRYQPANAAATGAPRPDVVFMGDSITEFWARYDPGFFGHGIVDRGISGQTSPQMLLRFFQDVIALHPRVVHIMAGTNDLAGVGGPTSPEAFENNIRAMVELAQAEGIRVVLASIPPASAFPWAPKLKPAGQIVALNAWLKAYAAERHAVYADYYTVLVDAADGGMGKAFTADGVHPTTLGYQRMRPIAEQAIAAAERAR